MGIRVLVVDDASFIRDMVKRQLREHIPGIEVLDANDGQRAVAMLKKQPFDLILSDWEMPGMSGEELLRWVRAEERYQRVPFVMVTSRGDRNHVLKAVEAGVSDYITKPFSAEELVKKTLRQLKKAGVDLNIRRAPGATQGVAFASVDVLTGGRAEAAAVAPSAAVAAAAVFAKPAAAAPVKPKGKGRAQLRFAQGSCTCVIRDLSLQACSGLIQRSDKLPTVFDQAVVDIESADGQSVARLNGFVQSIQAGEARADTQVVKIIIRFVDNDPDKFEFLSKYIAAQ